MIKNKKIPAVSIIMAAYNEELYISGAIKSIIEQTFLNWELIIIDDGSADKTVEVVLAFAEKDDRIVLLQNASNSGLPASLNKGISVSQGEYIARADADDINLPNRLAKQYEFMQANNDIDVLGTGAFLLDNEGNRVNAVCPPETHNELEKLSFLQTIFFHPSVMIRKNFFDKVGPYDVSFPRCQDKELWLRGLHQGCRYANLPDHLVGYRTGGYVRSWQSIKDKTISSWRMAKKYKIKRGYILVGISFCIAVAVKSGLWKPRSIR